MPQYMMILIIEILVCSVQSMKKSFAASLEHVITKFQQTAMT